eukprot:Phypoly_transcript_07110.p1 GENE.Phypoly_transcript_07110~~Phypoly_transcript_07110.p1  ORF type:complete len:305 (+),score=25.73 Phypoly_transcript_07110:66-980(+)
MILALTLVILGLIFVGYKKLYYVPPELEKLPGPPRVPILGAAHHLAGPMSSSWLKLHEKYGDVFFLKLLYINTINISDPILIQKAVQMKDVLQRRVFWDNYAVLFGKALFCIDGKDWQTRRTILNPHFRSQNINELFPVIAERAMRAVKYLKTLVTKEVNLDALFSCVTMDVISTFLISSHLDSASGEPNSMTNLFRILSAEGEVMAILPFWYYLPRPGKFAYLKYWRAFSKYIDQVIDLHLQDPSTEVRDILDVLLAAKTDRATIKNEIVGLMIAGHESTGHNLSFAIYHICSNKEILSNVMA